MKKTLLAVVASTIILSTPALARSYNYEPELKDPFGYNSIALGMEKVEVEGERVGEAVGIEVSNLITPHLYVRGAFSDFSTEGEFKSAIAEATSYSASLGMQYSPVDYGIGNDKINFYGDAGFQSIHSELGGESKSDTYFLTRGGVKVKPVKQVMLTAQVAHAFGDSDNNPVFSVAAEYYPIDNLAVGMTYSATDIDNADKSGATVSTYDSDSVGGFIRFKY